MDLTFELGSSESPAGHAIVYFTSADGPEVLATYVLVLPISVNLEKYVPPAFASFVQASDQPFENGTPLPPVAEEVESLEWLQATAQARRDDLVYAGELFSLELPNVIQMTQEAAAVYAALYRDRPALPEVPDALKLSGTYAELTESERLAEITQLVGRLRDSLGGEDAIALEVELAGLASTLPAKYRTDELLEWASRPGPTGQKLATLHLQRSYKLLNEQYLEVAGIEREIRELQAQ